MLHLLAVCSQELVFMSLSAWTAYREVRIDGLEVHACLHRGSLAASQLATTAKHGRTPNFVLDMSERETERRLWRE